MYQIHSNQMNSNFLNQSLLHSHHRQYQHSTNLSKNYDYSLEMLYRKFNRGLSELKHNSLKQKKKSLCCQAKLSPQSKFIIVWQLLNIILIYLYFIQIPIILAFENHRSVDYNERIFQIVNTPTIIFFLCGIFVNLNTSFYKDGLLKDNPVEIRQNYFRKTFLLDVLSISAILIYQILQVTDQFENQALKLFVLLFFLKYFQLAKIQRTMNRAFDLNRRTKAFLKLFLLLMKIILICNAVACSAFFISSYLAKNTTVIDKDGNPCTHDCFWVMYVEYAGYSLLQYDQNFGIQYIYSLYWASTTMISIGYGDITPKNPTEVGFTVFVQFLSCLLYGYAINEIWSLIQELNAKKVKIHSRLNIINLYMRDKGIDKQLNSKVNAYLNNYYYSKNLRERQIQSEIISQLTPSLRKQLFYKSYHILFKHKYFQTINMALKQSICASVKQVGYYQAEMVLMDINKQPSLYYVKRGELQYSTGNQHTFIKNFYNKDIFGIYQFFTQLCFKSQIKTKMYTLLFYIKASDWRVALQNHKNDFQRYCKIKEQLMIYGAGNTIGYKCQFCGSNEHRTEDCLDCQLRNSIITTSNLSRSDQNQRKIYLRRQFKIHLHERHHHKNKKLHHLHEKSRFQSQIYHQLPHQKTSFNHQSMHHKSYIHHQDAKVRSSSIEVSQLKLQQVKIHIKNHRNKHQNERAIERLRKQFNIRQQNQFQNESNQSYQAQFQQLDIDIATDYEQYYPKFNIKYQQHRDLSRRRFTKRF